MNPKISPINNDPRVEVKLRIQMKTINLVKRILSSGKYRSRYINDFVTDAVKEKANQLQKELQIEE